MAQAGDRMPSVAETIAQRKVNAGELAIYWLCQAGFAFKSSSDEVVYIDPYFSDVVERLIGFKRMMACPVLAEEANAAPHRLYPRTPRPHGHRCFAGVGAKS